MQRPFAVRGLSLLLLTFATACGSSAGDPAVSTDDSGSTDDSTAIPVDSTPPFDSAAGDTGSGDTGTVDSSVPDSVATDSGAIVDTATDSVAIDSRATDSTVLDGGTDTATTADTTTTSDTADAAAIDSGADTAIVDTAVLDSRADVIDAAALDSITCPAAVDAGAACNTLVNGGSLVSIVKVTDPTPTGTGGPIFDGTYYLTEFKAYAGAPFTAGPFGRQTLRICGNSGAFVNDEVGKTTERTNFVFAPVGNVPNDTDTCTMGGAIAIPYASYTATTRSLTLYSTVYAFSVTYTMP